MPNAGPASPAPSFAVLGETVDLLGVVVVKMSDKLDQHGQTLAGMQKIAVESRDAAQAAKAFSDPKRYADHIGQKVYDALGESLDRLEALHAGFATDQQGSRLALDELVRQEEQTLQRIRDDQARAGRWKKRIPFIALFGVVLALGLAIVLPRFMAGNAATCAVLGGEWLRGPESGKEACVFYAG